MSGFWVEFNPNTHPNPSHLYPVCSVFQAAQGKLIQLLVLGTGNSNADIQYN